MYKESKLDNGLTVLTYEDSSISAIDIRLLFRAGSRYEDARQKGYAHILEHMLLKGTAKRPSPVLLSQEIDNKGGYKNAYTGRDYLVMVLRAADNYSEELFELLSDMFFNSLIDPLILENEKKVIVEELNKAKDNNDTYLMRFTYEKFFSGHPLATNVLGNEESIMSSTPQGLIEYKKKFLIPNNSCLAVSGNIKHDKVVALAKQYFSGWEKAESALKNVAFTAGVQNFHYLFKDLQQTLISYNMETVPYQMTRELIALDLVQNFLNFGGSSLLNEELRHKRGLIYSVNTGSSTFSDTGLFSIRTSTSKPRETIETIQNIINGLGTSFTESSLAIVKARFIGSFKLKVANPYQQTDFLMDGYWYKGRLVPLDEYLADVESISYDDILNVISTYLRSEKAVVVAIGPENFTVHG